MKDHRMRRQAVALMVVAVAVMSTVRAWPASAQDLPTVAVLDFSGLMDDEEGIGGCRHPSAHAHEQMAAVTAARLRDVLGW